MRCYGTSNKKPKQSDEKEPSAVMYGLKYAVDASLALIVGVAAFVAIYYASCTPKEPEPVDHTPVEVLDNIQDE
jgi:hypothetical protein